jgi:hypothetical protein
MELSGTMLELFKVPKVFKACKVLQDRVEPRDPKEPQVLLAPLERLDLRDPKVQPDRQA